MGTSGDTSGGMESRGQETPPGRPGSPSADDDARLNPLLLAAEMRVGLEVASLLPTLPLLMRRPRGDGHAVIVIPPFGAGDFFTRVARTYLGRLGYDVYKWERREILGLHRLGTVAIPRLREIQENSGGKVSLVGHSLGGIYAREIARHSPDAVRDVVTVGSPFAGGLKSNYVWPMYEAVTGTRIAGIPFEFMERMNEPPPVPSTAIFSRTDGVASWQSCIERSSPTSENIEVQGSHIGLMHNPAVFYVLADRLAQPEGQWRPFEGRRFGAKPYVEEAP